MKKIIVDTNILFSCLLNSTGTIGDLIFNSDDVFEFYSNQYMRYEIRKHWNKLKKISGLSDIELEIAYEKMLLKINFINEELIPEKLWKSSENIANDIDIDDIDFIALAKYLKGRLWTGDKILYQGLKNKGFKLIINTSDLIKLRNRVSKF
jgi:predicted nucleic acid-binding protein